MLIAFNKPYGVICQFSPSGDKPTLKRFVELANVYPAGRLDTDSEGLLLLTDNGQLQAQIANPSRRVSKTYWAQVDGFATQAHLDALQAPLDLGDFTASPALAARQIAPPDVWERQPPVRYRATIPTSWIELTLAEGKNRQVRRMTAKVGLPTLRLIRVAIGAIDLIGLQIPVGGWRETTPNAVFA